ASTSLRCGPGPATTRSSATADSTPCLPGAGGEPSQAFHHFVRALPGYTGATSPWLLQDALRLSAQLKTAGIPVAMALNRRPDDWAEVRHRYALWIRAHLQPGIDMVELNRKVLDRQASSTRPGAVRPAKQARLPDAATAFQDTNRALKIRKYWLHLILTGEKVIEARGSKCAHVGRVTLMETGSALLRARVTITESHRMTDAEIQEHHEAVSALNYSQYWAWSLADVEVLQPPIAAPSIVARGSVTWMCRERWEAWDAGQLAAPQTLPQSFHRSGRSRSPPPATEEAENID
ncbi:unnamed protein product, partial [Symbiodinium sp. CCMP2456]